MDFSGKVAFVTGGSQGIGRALVSSLLTTGMKVCICDIDEEATKAFIETLPASQRENVIFQLCDVTSFDNFKGLLPRSVYPVYSATKHAVVGLTKSYGSDYHLERTGVRVNALCPAATKSILQQNISRNSLDEGESIRLHREVKFLEPEDVAKAMMELLQDGKNGALLKVEPTGTSYA
ncbi:unnamed protein product [Larinioides sclopetarius]|uniref:15-hydroxyprostaglandin dehydrogenase [NAD(+)] n=1 Tax=Larinioides sclopetarius TaxID=280406 RepID=A0AAV2AKK5_9ARAC